MQSVQPKIIYVEKRKPLKNELEYKSSYYLKNKQARLEYQYNYYRENILKIQGYNRKYWMENHIQVQNKRNLEAIKIRNLETPVTIARDITVNFN